MTPDELGMQPHPEGGWYRETWKHHQTIETPRGTRPLATAVAFLLQPGETSAWHRVASDELWLWQGGGPVRLTLVEDRLALTRATATAIRTPTSPRMYEIDGPDAWVELRRQHPLEVTASRRHEWYRTTGRNGPWIIPDWAAVGCEYDGVHLTVAGYLSTAGRALVVEGPSAADPSGSTMATILAGWDPDVTYWFVDLPEVAGAVTEWREGEDGRWQR